MRIVRIYQPQSLEIGQTVVLDANASHHLLQVLRLKVGTTFHLFNHLAQEFSATLLSVNKVATAKIDTLISNNTESPLYIHLAQSIVRGDKMDFILQKAVELGVQEITPLFSKYGEVQLSSERLEKKYRHWQGILIHAAEQSGRAHLPLLNLALPINTFLQQPSSNLRLMLHPHENNTQDWRHLNPNEVTLLVGPEGGFHQDEVELAKTKKVISCVLGPRILRTETAGLAAVACLQTLWGDF
jgi:16S rRNA (uracil1498-N3)-methyltransferase